MAVYDDQPGFAIHPMTSDAYQADLEAVLKPLSQVLCVLELGCGSGIFTQFLVTQGVNVVGIDRDEAQLARARQSLPQTAFVEGDFESAEFIKQIQLAHQQFDLIATRYVIHELSDPIETFRAWKQLLTSNGRLLLIENAWIRQDWGWGEWGTRTNQLPLACTQTWATAAYCLQKAGYKVTACGWMHQVNQLEKMQLGSGFRLYYVTAEVVM
jgi:SAM-dependent methyltransferase